MSDGALTINLRPSGDRVLLNFYVPAHLRAAFLEGIAEGTFANKVRMNFAASILPEWFSAEFKDHISVPVSALNVVFEDS